MFKNIIKIVLSNELTTKYGFITGIYFRKILKEIIRLGELNNNKISILDFGCGYGELKKLLKNRSNVFNYDIKPEYSEIHDYKSLDIDVIVVNQVFYTFTKSELLDKLNEFKLMNKDMKLIVGISKQNLFNKLFAILSFNFKAHKNTKLKINEEIEIISQVANLKSYKNVWFLTDVLLFEMK